MERLDAFEAMLQAVRTQAQTEQAAMAQLKQQGKEKSATYRQLMGNRLFLTQLLALYEAYGLLESPNS